jgi:hypothetical protein
MPSSRLAGKMTSSNDSVPSTHFIFLLPSLSPAKRESSTIQGRKDARKKGREMV